MLLPSPAAIVARTLPDGLPPVRRQVQARTGMFGSALDPEGTPGDPGLFGPGSATWKVTGQPSMMLAGLRAALLQTLSVPVPTATHSTGAFYRDFLGRVARTGAFVQKQNLGSMDEVRASARRVRAMHGRVNGTGDDGTRFDANDPHQQAWVSMTLTDSILAAAERFGTALSAADADRFVAEQSRHGALLDPRVDLDAIFADPEQRAALQAGTLPLPLVDEGELPVTRDHLRSLMAAWTGELDVTPLTRRLLDGTVQLTEVPQPQRSAIRPFVLATLSTIPDPWHEMIAPEESRLEELVSAQLVQGPLALLQAVLGRGAGLEHAERRANATADRLN